MNIFVIGVAHKNSHCLLASPYMEKELHLLGIEPTVIAAADEAQLTAAFQQAMLLGGLILTPLTGNAVIDQLLSENIAKACGVPMELNQHVFQQIAERNVKLTREEAVRLSTLPKGAQVYAVHENSAPAYQLDGENIHAIVLPADPVEQCAVFLNTVFPTFAQQPKYPCSSHILRVMDLSLAEVESALKAALSSENPCVAVYPGKEETIIRVAARAQNQQQAASACQTAAETILEHLSGYVYGVDVPNIERALLQHLEKKRLNLALMESGTGGRGEKRLNKCKKDNSVTLSFAQEVPAEFSQAYGTVSLQTASALAAAASDSATIGVAITMPTAQEKAASAYAAASFNGHVLTKELPITGFQSVQQLENACVSHALNLARKFAESYPSLPKGAAAAAAVLTAKKTTAAHKEETAAMTNKTEKKSPGKKILRAIFPQKSDSKSEKMRKAGILLCLCVFCGSMGYLLNHHQQGVNAGLENERLNSMLQDAIDGKLEVDQELLDKVAPEVLDKYKPFVAINEDMKGWIQIPDTQVSYPVVQAQDNEYYHRKNFEGEYDYYGVPYLDFECSINVDDISDNLIIYGHNIGNDGLMFNPLSYYKQLDFYKSHPVVRFDSIYQEQEYKIFGVFITNAQPEQDNGTVFRYNTFVDLDDEDEFNTYVNEVRRRSMWDIDVDVQPGDKLLTLSTCTYDFRPEARIVIVARAVREGEDATVDTSTAVQNVDAYFPQAYYDALNEKAKYGQVKGITIDGKDEYTLEVGQTLQLKAITTPADAPINTATWDSSASAIATVNSKTGLVTAVAPGEVNITAMADDGGYVDTVKIIVKAKNALEYLYFDYDEISLSEGQSTKLKVYLEPEDAAVDLQWSADSDCLYTAVNKSNPKELYMEALSATDQPVPITVTDKLTGISATCNVTVGGQSSSVSLSTNYLEFTLGSSGQIYVMVNPASAASGLYAESRYDCVDVSSPINNGNGTVTFTIKDYGQVDDDVIIFYLNGQEVGRCQVVVKESGTTPPVTPPADENQPENITITNSFNETLNDGRWKFDGTGNYGELTVEGAKNYQWNSTDYGVAYVDDNGELQIVGEGEAIITVTGPNGGKAQFTVRFEGSESSDNGEETPSDESGEDDEDADPDPEKASKAGGETIETPSSTAE